MNGYGYGPRSGSGSASGRFRGGRSAHGGARSERGRGFAPGQRGARDARGGPHRGGQCPPELREPFKIARDFIAGLVGAIGMPARLSYGGVEPARDGRQVTISIEAIREPGAPPRTYGRPQYDDRRRERELDVEGDLGVLIGKHGATLEALTAIVNAVMHHHDSEGIFFSVDVEGYRARRVASLRSLALRGADRALREGVAIELSPMPPGERRIVHMTLAANDELSTQSTGVGANRRVVIVPRGVEPIADEDNEEFAGDVDA